MHFIVCTIRPGGGQDLDGGIVVDDRQAKDALKKYYTEKAAAVNVAKALAAKFPTIQFGVFEPAYIFETVTPKVITKKLNEQGEVVLAKEE